ncbi:MAG: shikimate kinase [Candidatus Goldiibacteriota bacterium]
MDNIILIGFMGSGKTAVGKKLAKKTGREFIDIDAEIVKREGMPIKKIFEDYGEKYFRKAETETARIILKKKNRVVAAGGGIVVKKSNISLLKKGGTVVYLKNSFLRSAERLKGKTDRPLFTDLKKARQLYNSRLGLYEKAADIKVFTDKKTVSMTADAVKKKTEGSGCGQ